MKKILFAATAFIAIAGMAAAEVDVTIKGYGRFGVGYHEDRATNVDGAAPDVSDTILVSRFRLNIDGITETDSGVKFEARVRLQADGDNKTGEAKKAGFNGARFSVSYGGFRTDVGNVGDAFTNLANFYGTEPGLENFAAQYSGVDYGVQHYSSGGAGSNALYFSYGVGGFSFAGAYDQQSFDADKPNESTPGDSWSFNVAYKFNNITLAVAHGQTDKSIGDDDNLTVLTLGGEWDGFSGSLFVAEDDVNTASGKAGGNGTAYGVSGAFEVGTATSLKFAYGDGSAQADARHLGVGFVHDLGGGASLRGGVGQIKAGDADSIIKSDFGVQFNF
ncbi:porin [Ruegeria sp.]|uniref:porin n=1 Tax=Ruegeria sp. TaxID=1879320 RepID=UPI003AFFCABB